MMSLQIHPSITEVIVQPMATIEVNLVQNRQLQKQLKHYEAALIEINKSLEKAEIISEAYYTLQSHKIALYEIIYEIKEQL